MGKTHPRGEPESAAPAADRLDSWKEIAAYLRRDVRTLRRWEKSEALPVHRHLHNKLPAVYAYRSELEAWWNNRRPRLEEQEQAQQKRALLWRRMAWAVSATVALAAAVWLGWWWARRPPLPFAERDWVLIASFENRSGVDDFDGTLEHVLERELSNSRYVNVVPRHRAADTLLLMRKPADTRLDADLAREVALRDGGVRAVLAGRIERLGPRLVMSVGLVNPADGVMAASLSEEAENEADVGPALRRLAARTRQKLGERLPLLPKNQPPLERVTTPSLRALRLFSQGSLLKEQYRVKEAEPLFREAIKQDPEFATAHMWLAWTVSRLDGPREQVLQLAQRSLELSHNASERERLFNQASYYIFTKKYEPAYSTLQALLQLHPDDYWATLTMTWLPQRVGRPEETQRHKLKLAELRPNDLVLNHEAAYVLLIEQNDAKRAQTFLERARKLAAAEIAGDPPSDSLWHAAAALEFMPAWSALLGGDGDKAHTELVRLAGKLDGLGGRFHDEYAAKLSALYRAFGQLREAEKACNSMLEAARRHWCLCFLALDRGDAEAFRQHRRNSSAIRHWYTIRLAYLGFDREAREEIRQLQKQGVVPGWNETARGLLALRQGRREALPQLEEATKQLRSFNPPNSLLGALALAEFYEREGDLPNAVRVLEEAERELSKDRNAAYGGANVFLEARARLAALCRKAGRIEQAEILERDLRKRLAYADPDHPILRQIH